MTTRLTFLGVAGYLIEGSGRTVLIDPYLTGNPVAPVRADELPAPDVILVSHAAYDHLGDTADIARRTGSPVVCGADTRALLLEQGIPPDQIRATIWGIVVEVGGVVVRPVESHHWSSARLEGGGAVSGVPLGFIIEPEHDVRIYHFGDSAIFGDMRLIGELYRPTIGLLGCTQPKPLLSRDTGAGRVLTGEMSPAEAALAAEFLGVRLAVATHYTDPGDEDVLAFLRLVPEHDTTGARAAIALEPGQVLAVDGSDHVVEPR
jgi:L-ascorbate metabolism protein UlaG (beta-lactamase superfamily)